MLTKKYEKDGIKVVWKPELCYHSENCTKGLPEVFKPKEKPWIQVDGATRERIVNQVKKCPSGALSIESETTETDEVDPNSITVIETIKNGPVMVKGKISLKVGNGGSEILQQDRIALCRCGSSANKPFCDGTHTRVDFKAD